MRKAHHVRTTFGRSTGIFCGKRNGFCSFAAKFVGFAAVDKPWQAWDV
jgi:hypothetical protein